LDEIVGRIIADLKARNVLHNTLVVIIGDHGESFGEHRESGHGIFCYNEVLKVPLIFYNPGRLPLKGHRVSNRVNQVDLMPTLMDLYGLETPPSVQGTSFLPLLTGEEEEGQRNFYFESMHGSDEMGWAPLLGIIEGNYKYISLPEPELYDLKDDRNETDKI
ncbi:MAG: sulfatase-like hydrolase/transferase, partial [bacterium]|nr:sulfatase-like hydrolase/transferase [bacterium]